MHDGSPVSSTASSPHPCSPSSSPQALSPVTSPLQCSSPSPSPSPQHSSTPNSPVPRKKRRKLYSRTTLRRKLQEAEQDESDVECDHFQDFQQKATLSSVYKDNNNSSDIECRDFLETDIGHYSSNSSDKSSECSTASIKSSCHESSDDTDTVSNSSQLDSSIDTSMQEALSSDTEDELYAGSNILVDEAIFRTLRVYVKERWTKTSLDSNVKLIRSLLPEGNLFPKTGKHMLSKLNELSSFQVETEHYYCLSCRESKQAEKGECLSCKVEAQSGIFYQFCLESQLKFMFEHRNLASAIDEQRNRTASVPEGHITDIQDGVEYKKIRDVLSGRYDIVLVMNSDGVNLSSSSKQELWGILSIISDIHPRKRYSFMLVSGVFVDKVKPNMNVFLKPFVDSLNSIWSKGGVTWTHPHYARVYTSKVACPVFCVDAPAKAMILNMKTFSHRFGCNICEQKAVRVSVDPETCSREVESSKKKKTKTTTKKKTTLRRFVFQDEEAKLRTHLRMTLQGELAELRKKPRKGVLGKTVLEELPLVDLGVCLSAEYMHTVLLGATRYILDIIFNVRGPWYIGKHIPEIDDFMKSIRVPYFVKRLPRGIKDLKFLKASELRALLIYFSLPAFHKFLPAKYLQHLMLLVAAIYLLLKEDISSNDLDLAEAMLRCFVRDIGKLYHNKFYTYNIHNLLHLPLLVRRWGPLWSTSAFDFENYNGFITSHVHGTKHLGKELLNNIKIIQSLTVLENSLQGMPRATSSKIRFGSVVDIQLSPVERNFLSSRNITEFVIYDRVKTEFDIFTSREYDRARKRANSFVEFDVRKYGEILHFVETLGEVFCLIAVFKIRHNNIFFLEDSLYQLRHLLPVTYSNDLTVIPVSSIITKVIKAGNYLCLRPNHYEVNL
ncbi:Serine/threonine-protein kinase TEL1 [Frankliniella fusca]|uniref:Serine/threonine-protein kinase TEL1 n=2 Tax=Frankliniella fusca TaxID=407009 RepID=A0AAE1LM78_9NEOP|nr:Serine/threonine-protein kinase TEL1 [Frankliniella fusca]